MFRKISSIKRFYICLYFPSFFYYTIYLKWKKSEDVSHSVMSDSLQPHGV